MLDHLRAVERQTGIVHPMLADAPSLPEGLEELWRIFGELHACRSYSAGMSGLIPNRITYGDLDAFERVTGVKLAPWELEAIRRADNAYLLDYAERNRPRGD